MTDDKTEQSYWRLPEYPYLEYRETIESLIAYKTHQHASLSIGAIVSGETVLTLPCGKKMLKQGDLVIIQPHIAHSCNPFDTPRSYGMLYIDPALAVSILKAPAVFSVTNSDLFDHYFYLIDRLKKGESSIIGSLFEDFMALLSRHLPSSDRPIKTHRLVEKSKKILCEAIEYPPSLAQLSAQCGLRPESLIRLFKRYTGMTPKSYLNNIRIEQAKHLLKQGDSITNISYQLGFSDQSHFQKTFRLYSAITPKNYQQNQLDHY